MELWRITAKDAWSSARSALSRFRTAYFYRRISRKIDRELRPLRSVEIERLDKLDDRVFEQPGFKFLVCRYILTQLALMRSGCIVAKLTDADEPVRWLISHAPAEDFWPASVDGELLAHKAGYLGSLLAGLGWPTVREVYSGAGPFLLSFKGGYTEKFRRGIMFANERHVGYWIKLYVIEQVPRTTQDATGAH